MSTLRPLVLAIGLVGLLPPLVLAAPEQAGPTPTISAEQCKALAAYATSRATQSALRDVLAHLPEAPTSIMRAAVIPAERDVPEVCQVNGIVAPDIQFELRMPTSAWNGKFMHYGCGGACGIVYRPQLEEPLARGYAVVASDMGHSSSPNSTAFMYGDLQAIIDFSYRATHAVTVASKEVLKGAYGVAPRFSYMFGCSTGGVQGMIEAQRYPHDFDGVVAGAPSFTNGPSYGDWNIRANLDAKGDGIFDPDKLPMLRKAVLAKCDRLDGLEDGLLQDPRVCTFDPVEIACKGGREANACLTAAEVGVARKIYAGPTTSDGKPIGYGATGMSRGSEYEWSPSFIGEKGKPHPAMASAATRYGNGVYPGSASNAGRLYDYDADPAADYVHTIYEMGPTLQWLRWAGSPDLRRFRDAGAKLIVWHGWDDDNRTPGSSADYNELVTRTMGGEAETQKFYRLFMMPGVAHCRRGPGGDSADWMTAIETWVEKGLAPDEVITHHLVKEQSYLGLPRPRYPLPAGSYDRTRPIYPYPAVARYKGDGDPALAASWRKGGPLQPAP